MWLKTKLVVEAWVVSETFSTLEVWQKTHQTLLITVREIGKCLFGYQLHKFILNAQYTASNLHIRGLSISIQVVLRHWRRQSRPLNPLETRKQCFLFLFPRLELEIPLLNVARHCVSHLCTLWCLNQEKNGASLWLYLRSAPTVEPILLGFCCSCGPFNQRTTIWCCSVSRFCFQVCKRWSVVDTSFLIRRGYPQLEKHNNGYSAYGGRSGANLAKLDAHYGCAIL